MTIDNTKNVDRKNSLKRNIQSWIFVGRIVPQGCGNVLKLLGDGRLRLWALSRHRKKLFKLRFQFGIGVEAKFRYRPEDNDTAGLDEACNPPKCLLDLSWKVEAPSQNKEAD